MAVHNFTRRQALPRCSLFIRRLAVSLQDVVLVYFLCFFSLLSYFLHVLQVRGQPADLLFFALRFLPCFLGTLLA
jgi:hypothetical protein